MVTPMAIVTLHEWNNPSCPCPACEARRNKEDNAEGWQEDEWGDDDWGEPYDLYEDDRPWLTDINDISPPPLP